MRNLVLVTGGAGFIGSHLVDALLEQGARVRILDNLSSGKLDNLSHCKEDVEFVNADLRNPEACHLACQGVDTVFHEAAIASVPLSIADPVTSHAVNVEGTLHMLLAAREQGVRRFIFASSSAVYGNTTVSPTHEAVTPCPLSPYAIEKLMAEHYCRVFHSLYGMETVALRYFNVFGPRQDPNSAYSAVIPKFVASGLGGQKVTVNGDGGQSRDFVYVKNVVQANLLASWIPGVAGSVFNVGCGSSHTLIDLCRGIENATGRKMQIEHGPAREGDIRHSMADITAARQRLRYEPAVSLQEGLDRTIQFAASHFMVQRGRSSYPAAAASS